MTRAWTAPQIFQTNNLTGRRINWHGIQMRDAWSLSGKRSGPLKFHVGLAGLSVRFSEWILGYWVTGRYWVLGFVMPTILQVLTFRSVCLSSIGTNCANDSKVRSRWSYNRGTSTNGTSTKRIELRNFYRDPQLQRSLKRGCPSALYCHWWRTCNWF